MLHSQSETWTYQICFFQLNVVSMTVKGALINCEEYFLELIARQTVVRREALDLQLFGGYNFFLCCICVHNEEGYCLPVC